MVRRYPGRVWLVTDVAVPISNYPEIVDHAAGMIEELELDGGLIGHAGDGNLHSAIFYHADDEAAQERVALFNDRLVTRALELEGTCTGEHGVGVGKQKYMEKEHGPAAMQVMRRLKLALDPNGILNPGKVLGEYAVLPPGVS
jgi:D-lactate dehydrogenase (cytochrome)